MTDVQNIRDCRAAIEAHLGPLEWGAVDAVQQSHAAWPHKGGAIDVEASSVASRAIKAHLDRKGVSPAMACLEIESSSESDFGPQVVLRVAYT